MNGNNILVALGLCFLVFAMTYNTNKALEYKEQLSDCQTLGKLEIDGVVYTCKEEPK